MKVLLVNQSPYNISLLTEKRIYQKRGIFASPPLGLAYLSAYIKQAGFDVQLFDGYTEDFSLLQNFIEREKPNVIGISCLSHNYPNVWKIAKLAKKYKDIVVVIGGPHATALPKETLKMSGAAVIVMGEGELTFLELLERLRDKKPFFDILGIAYLNHGNVKINNPRPLIENLDELPFPNYDDINWSKYFSGRYEKAIIKKNKLNPQEFQDKSVSVVSSRGCIGNCFFCTAPSFWNNKYRVRSPENIVDEIEWLYNKYGRRIFMLGDSVLGIDKNGLPGICKEILSRNLKIIWCFETRSDLISPSLLKEAYQSGCRAILYGVESGSAKVLHNLGKPDLTKSNYLAIRWTKAAGILAGAFIMVGSPGETAIDFQMTMDFLRNAKPDFLQLARTIIYPGTQLERMAKENGIIKNEDWLINHGHILYRNDDPNRFERYFLRAELYKRGKIIHFLLRIRDMIADNYGIVFSSAGIYFKNTLNNKKRRRHLSS